jgi:creatinine amidohydrolase
MRQRSVRWGELRAPELRALAEIPATVVVPVASIEQHGPHLPTMTDTLLGHEIARAAAERTVEAGRACVVTEPVWSGLSEHHMALGATLSLDFQAFLGVLRGVVGSLRRHGFRRILLLNSHGGNVAALKTFVEELTKEMPELRLVTATHWHLAGDLVDAVLETQRSIRHACEAETSLVMALRPELVDTDRLAEAACPDPRDADGAMDDGAYRWESFADKTPSGALGDPRAASAEKGHRLLALLAGRLAERLADPAFWGERG